MTDATFASVLLFGALTNVVACGLHVRGGDAFGVRLSLVGLAFAGLGACGRLWGSP